MPEQETVGAYLRRWLEFKQGQLRPRTYTSYEHIVRAHLDPGLGRVRLAKLAPHDVAAWLRRHQKNGASARTTRYARSVLRAALNQALRWELVLRNAAALTDPPRYRAREIQPLTPDQASGPPRHNLRTRTWVAARNHRRITAPHTRTFNHGAALEPCSRSSPAIGLRLSSRSGSALGCGAAKPWACVGMP